MGTRIFNMLSLISSILLGCTVILWILSFVVSPYDHRLSITASFHIGVWGGCDGPFPVGRLVFFNDKESGPYRGSIVNLTDAHGNLATPMTSRAWGDTLGIYYRYFHWLGTDQTLWTLAVSLAYPFLLFGILPAASIWRRWQKWAKR